MDDQTVPQPPPPAPPPAADMLTYQSAADLLGVKLATLYAWVTQRRVPHFKLGRRCVRFSHSELTTWLQARAVPARAAATTTEVM
jgi:excisionase family DNA binding protein